MIQARYADPAGKNSLSIEKKVPPYFVMLSPAVLSGRLPEE